MPYRLFILNADGWTALRIIINQNQANTNITDTIIRQLQELGAASFIIEDDYIDRDFSEAYTSYYAKTFKRHIKLCKRLLFFAADISFVLRSNDPLSISEELERQDFLGQIILRPVTRAPINSAILRVPPIGSPYESHLLVKGRYAAHVWGAELAIEGAPMTQQDSRVGACAQAAIWVAARHFHTRHRGPWLSTVSITAAAIKNSESGINQVLPAGSEFLSLDNMVSAMRAAGQEALVYAAASRNQLTGQPVWGSATRPVDIINRYVDSGIPVILGLQFTGQPIGHAIIITGQILRDVPTAALPLRPSRGAYCEAFYANDDQIGPNIRVPVSAASAIGNSNYNITDNAMYVMIPLPKKVYLPAETAEALSWGIMNNYVKDWAAWKTSHSATIGSSNALGDKVASDFISNEIIARTYLTYGWKYKMRGVKNKLDLTTKNIISDVDLPRFVYVTEFSCVSSTSSKSKYERRIIAHSVVDATAKHHDIDSILLFHAPGFCMWHKHDSSGQLKRFVAPIQNSEEYYPKSRGELDFKNFQKGP